MGESKYAGLKSVRENSISMGRPLGIEGMQGLKPSVIRLFGHD
jgi:hypothetical protein